MAHQPSSGEILYELDNSHDNRAPDLVVSFAICISLAYIAVLLRIGARSVSKAGLKRDDFMIISALVGIPVSRAR